MKWTLGIVDDYKYFQHSGNGYLKLWSVNRLKHESSFQE